MPASVGKAAADVNRRDAALAPCTLLSGPCGPIACGARPGYDAMHMNRCRDWLDQAVRDLEKARIDMEYRYWEWACFTAQQAAEKAVRGLLMARGHDVRGHAITPMIRTLPDAAPGLTEKAQPLDAHYIPPRYPNGFPQGKPADYYNQAKADEAVCAAEDIIRFCQDHLPEPR